VESDISYIGCKWKDNIKMDVRETGYEDVNWVVLAQNRVQWLGF
jgi:hypothetical protein